MGIVSLVIGVLALLLCWLPMMNRMGYAIGGVGVLLGIFGLVVAAKQQGASIGFPIGGLALSILGLALAIQMDQGVQAIKAAIVEKVSGRAPKRPKPQSNSPDGAEKGSPVEKETGPSGPSRWLDATKTLVTVDGVRMKVQSTKLGPTIKDGLAGRQEVGPYLVITLQASNQSDTKNIDFKGWSNEIAFGEPQCSLVDEHGNQYKQMKSGIGGKWEGQVLSSTIAPRESMIDVLVFEPPVNVSQELKLSIPAAPLGREGWFGFLIPRRMFEQAPTPETEAQEPSE